MIRMVLAVLCSCASLETFAAEIPTMVMQRAQSVCKIQVCNAVGSCSYLGQGYWLTNQHVVCDCGKSTIHLKDGDRVAGQTVWKGSTVVDLALVKSKEVVSLAPLPLSDSPPAVGEIVYPTGYDFGRNHYVWPARTAERWNSSRAKYVGLDSRKGAVAGNSGGPVLNANGEIIAALNANSGGSNRLGTGSTLDVGFNQTRDFLTQFFQRNCPNGQCPQIRGGYVPGVVVPVLPKSAQPKIIDITPKVEKPDLEPDWEKLKRQLLEDMAADPRFKGPQGERGPAGLSATPPPVDVEAIVARVKREVQQSLKLKVRQ